MYMDESMDRFPYLLGGFSQYGYVMPEAGRVRVPDNVSNELATLSSCAFRSVIMPWHSWKASAQPTWSLCKERALLVYWPQL
jgi:hypothetical protein